MGIVLVFGTVALFVAIAFKVKADKVVPKDNISIIKSEVKCNYTDANISVPNEIASASTNSNILTIITKPLIFEKSQEIINIDLCSGQILSRVNVVVK